MRKDLTEIVLISDRSGSMEICRSDAQNGINAFIREQKEQPGEANFTLVEFDHEYNFVHKGKPIKEVGEYKLCPRGMTALNDAIGRTINETGARLAAMNECNRPGCVVVVIVTDGEENSSREFTVDKIKDMITHQSEKYGWRFSYLMAGVDQITATKISTSYGVSPVSTQCFAAANSSSAYLGASNLVSRCRSMSAEGVTLTDANFKYTDEEKAAMTEDTKVAWK